jgi:S1-C subfamily serine protease
MGSVALALWLAGCAATAAESAGGPCARPPADIYLQASPAVVFITAMSINPYRMTDRVEQVVGSGFLFDKSGLVLTNAHVVFARQTIAVTLDDGTMVSAQPVGADPLFDIAVVRIPGPEKGDHPTLPLGDSDKLQVGEDVLAIGNPMGLEQTLTRGIVSAMNRILPETPFSLMEPMIQTDTPINPGNSGGPLLNRCGEVVGMNTAVLPEAQNISFAIPINLVKAELPSLVAHGRMRRPWLGFHGQLVTPELLALLRIPLTEGLLIEVVEPGSPAETAGLQGGELEIGVAGRTILVGGDIVTAINQTRITSLMDLMQVMRKLEIGSTVRLTVFRAGERLDVSYELPERPILPTDVRGQGALRLQGRRPRP